MGFLKRKRTSTNHLAMNEEPITLKTYALGIALLALLILGLAIQGGAWGPSDLELFKRAAGL